jgi:hypothetical protein
LSASVVEGPWPACPVDLGLGHASFKRLVVDPELLTDPNARASPCHWIFRAHRLSAGSSDPAAPPGTSAVPARSYLPWLAGLHQTRHRTTRPSPPTHRAGSSPSYPARHRAHARVQDRIRTGKDTGIGHLPSRHNHINQIWVELALIAADLLALAQSMLLTQEPDLTRAEPKALRYRLLHIAARITRGQRKVFLRLAEHWPWALALAKAFTRLRLIPLPA